MVYGNFQFLQRLKIFFGVLWLMLFQDNLLQHRVKVHPLCPICNALNETIYHILVYCSFAKTCWMSSVIGFAGSFLNFGEWLEALFVHCNGDDCSLAAMICWGIWLNRNNKVWKNINGRATNVLNLADQSLFQWQQARTSSCFAQDYNTLDHGLVC